MLPQCFVEYHQNREKGIRAHFERIREYPSVDAVHELRVEIKRLRAFYQLIGWLHREFNEKALLRDSRKLFKGADKLRDLHVQMELTRELMIKQVGNLSEYYNVLASALWRREIPFHHICRNYDPDILEEGLRQIRNALADFTEGEVRYRTELRLAVLARQLIKSASATELTEKDLHQIRIKTKEARYVLEVLSLCRPPTDRDVELNDALRKSHQALGRWHDRLIGLVRFRKFLHARPKDYFFDFQSCLRFGEALTRQRDQFLDDFKQNWPSLERLLHLYGQKVDAH